MFTPLGGANVAELALGASLFTSVGTAVGAAAPGDTILIANDNDAYTEDNNLTVGINKSLTFAGVGSTAERPRPVLLNSGARFFGITNAGSSQVNFSALAFDGNGTGGGLAIQPLGNTSLVVTITNCLFRNNRNGTTGGAAFNADVGTVHVLNCVFEGNQTISSLSGGAIAFRSGTGHTVTGCLFRENQSAGTGGAIALASFLGLGTVELTDSTFDGNIAASGQRGGAISMEAGALSVRQCTFANNEAPSGQGGAISTTGGTLTVDQSTLVGNSAATGGGLHSANITPTLRNTLVAGNNASASVEVSGNVTDGGGNLPALPPGLVRGDVVVVDGDQKPILAPYGGSRPVVALAAASPAVNAGVDPLIPAGIVTDQRGAGFPRTVGMVDVGAFEAPASPTLATSALTVTSGAAPVQLAAASGPSPGGGVFTGPGVAAGLFDPSSLPLGSYRIVYGLTAAHNVPVGAALIITVAEAPSLTVTSTADTVDPTDGQTSLREALA